MSIEFNGVVHTSEATTLYFDHNPGKGFRRVVTILAQGLGQGGEVGEQLQVQPPDWMVNAGVPEWKNMGPIHAVTLQPGQTETFITGVAKGL